jgi:hypothetical protein
MPAITDKPKKAKSVSKDTDKNDKSDKESNGKRGTSDTANGKGDKGDRGDKPGAPKKKSKPDTKAESDKPDSTVSSTVPSTVSIGRLLLVCVAGVALLYCTIGSTELPPQAYELVAHFVERSKGMLEHKKRLTNSAEELLKPYGLANCCILAYCTYSLACQKAAVSQAMSRLAAYEASLTPPQQQVRHVDSMTTLSRADKADIGSSRPARAESRP